MKKSKTTKLREQPNVQASLCPPIW